MAPSPEYRIQTEVAKHLTLAYPDVLTAVSPAAGFKVSMGLAMKMMRMGYQKGTPDLIILEPRIIYHGLVIELKTPTGVLSSEQKSYLKKAAARGYLTAVCRSAKSAIDLIDNYLASPF
jgi:hypothetical protein